MLDRTGRDININRIFFFKLLLKMVGLTIEHPNHALLKIINKHKFSLTFIEIKYFLINFLFFFI